MGSELNPGRIPTILLDLTGNAHITPTGRAALHLAGLARPDCKFTC